jgi:arsenite methyltransferase
LTVEQPAETSTPPWLLDYLGGDVPSEGGSLELGRQRFEMRGGMLRSAGLLSDAQNQTADAFAFKWARRETFESSASVARMREWLIERYGDVAAAPWWSQYGPAPLLLDAGCGAALSALALFGPILQDVRYLGIDVSGAVDVAARRFRENGVEAAFMQADLVELPFPAGTVDVIFSEGVLHHTDSTRGALLRLATLLRTGGRFLFYVYRKKGPIREFTDDYVRDRLRTLTPDDAWAALRPLTRLGRALGELELEVDVPEDIELLEIPAGRVSIQRLFYWHVMKAFYDPDLDLEELNHINYDWYAPANAHRQSPDEVRSWCDEAALEIEHENVQPAGITVIARKR